MSLSAPILMVTISWARRTVGAAKAAPAPRTKSRRRIMVEAPWLVRPGGEQALCHEVFVMKQGLGTGPRRPRPDGRQAGAKAGKAIQQGRRAPDRAGFGPFNGLFLDRK